MNTRWRLINRAVYRLRYTEKPCPVCGHWIENHPFAICFHCMWECDPVSDKRHNYAGGANEMTLNEARRAYRKGIPVR
jgi:hypothetical protein